MGSPVVHFEIIGSNPERLRTYYGELFGWQFDTSATVPARISDPTDYGFITPDPDNDPPGIPGGVGGGPGYENRVLFYVGVDDVETALQHAERLGGTRQVGPEHLESGLVVGQFADPDGRLIGLAAGIG